MTPPRGLARRPPTTVLDRADVDAVLPRLDPAARAFARAARADNTIAAYAWAFGDFVAWCQARDLAALPADPATVANYLAACAEDPDGGTDGAPRRVSTLNIRKCAIAKAHELAALGSGQPVEDPTKHPAVRIVWEGIRRARGAPPVKKRALTSRELGLLFAQLEGASLRAVRDRALFALALFGAFRRSELCALRFTNIEFLPEGLRVVLARSKTDQTGAGRIVGVPRFREHLDLCPVAAVEAWIAASGLREGPLFRGVRGRDIVKARGLSPHAYVARIKQAAEAAGLDPAVCAGHSFRAGFVTEALANGASPFEVMATTGHKSFDMLREYLREASLWKDNAANRVGRPSK